MTQTMSVAPSLSSSAVKDQSFLEPTNLGCAIHEVFAYVAQTYTASVNGNLAGISINIRSTRSLSPEKNLNFYRLHVAVCAVKAGYPDAVLTETLLETDEAQEDEIIRFPDMVSQIAGTHYAIVVHYVNAPAAGPGQSLGVWSGANGNHYPAGELFYGPDGRTWFVSSLNGNDAHFRTYVVPD